MADQKHAFQEKLIAGTWLQNLVGQSKIACAAVQGTRSSHGSPCERLSWDVGLFPQAKQDATELQEKSKQLKQGMADLEEQEKQIIKDRDAAIMVIGNVVHDSVPVDNDEVSHNISCSKALPCKVPVWYWQSPWAASMHIVRGRISVKYIQYWGCL